MAELSNLNRARKAKAKSAAKVKAEENRIASGRTKVEQIVARLDAARLARDLDGKKRAD